MDLFVVRDHVGCVCRCADVPRLACVIQQRCVATPAVRIAVRVGFLLEQQAAGFQVCSDFRVGSFEEFAGIWRHGIRELPARIERLDHREVVL